MARKPVSRDGCAPWTYRQSLWKAVNVLLGAAFFREAQQAGGGRRWTARMLVWAALQMGWLDRPTLGERFEAVRRTLDQQFPGRRRVGRSYRSYTKALASQSPHLLPKVEQVLREQTAAFDGMCQKQFGFAVSIVDGSKIELPRVTALEKTFGFAGKERSAPQALLTVLLSLMVGVPIDYRVGPGKASERAHLRSMMHRMPVGSLLLGDPLYTNYELLRALHDSGRYFLVRVGANVRLLKKLGYYVKQNRDTVYLWPNEQARLRQPPLVLRQIRVKDRDRMMTLVTNVMERRRLPHKKAKMMYRMRWGVELFYRTLKRTLGRTKLLSRSAPTAAYELRWAVIALWMLRLMTARARVSAGQDPLRLSVAQALRHVRAMLAEPSRRLRRGDSLERRLAGAGQDDYQRKGPKQTRDWPRKKRHRPPGTPPFIDATESQVREAQRLRDERPAA